MKISGMPCHKIMYSDVSDDVTESGQCEFGNLDEVRVVIYH